MKFNYLIKATPFLSTLLLIVIISISNQKQYTKLRILIWNTPSLTLGTYLAISTGSGFLLSYLMTLKLAKIYHSTKKEVLHYKVKDRDDEIDEYTKTNQNPSYENALIDRNIKDPSPTIKASFRIIGGRDQSNSNFINFNDQYDDTTELEAHYDETSANNKVNNQVKSFSNDWNDDSFSRW